MRQPAIGDLLLTGHIEYNDLTIGIIETIEIPYKGQTQYIVRWMFEEEERLGTYYYSEVMTFQGKLLNYCKQHGLSVGWDYEDLKTTSW